MATLLKCIECGRPVSSQASECPHCSTRYPLGVKCIVCCEHLKRSEAIKKTKEYGGAENRISVKFFHRSCYERVSTLKLGKSRTSCPVCKSAIEFDTSSTVNCSNCGQKINTRLEDPTFAPCCYCGFHLNQNLEVAVKEVSRQFLTGWTTETLYAHKVCYTTERQEQERISQQRERIEKKHINRKKNESIRKRQSARNKETLFLSIFLGLALGVIVGGGGGVTSHFIFGFGASWKNAALFGSCSVFLLTVVAVWLFSLFE